MNRVGLLHQAATALFMASDDYVHAVGHMFMTLDESLLPGTDAKERALHETSTTVKTLVPIETALLCDDFVEISLKIPRDPTDGFEDDDAERMNTVRLALVSDFNDIIRKADAETK